MQYKLLVFFFSLMLLFPATFQAIRGVLLLLLVIASLKIAQRGLWVGKGAVRWWIFTLLVSIISMFWGLANENPGALTTWTVYVLWPLLYLYFAGCNNKLKLIEGLERTIINVGLYVLVINIIFLFNAGFLQIGIMNQIAEFLNYRFNVAGAYVEFNTPSQSLIPYLLFFATTLLLLGSQTLRIKRMKLVLIIILSFVAILLSRRRIMWLIVLALPFVEIIFLYYYDRKSSKITKQIGKILLISFVALGVMFIGISYFLDVEDLTSEFLSSFDFDGDASNYERTLQSRSLHNDFLNNPILGRGQGFVSSYIRTPDKPWEYELTYDYILGSHGIIGFGVYLFATLWIFVKSKSIIYKSRQYIYILLPQLTGLFIFLIINETNPYMNKFDFLWILFLPVVTINTIERNLLKN